MKTLIGQVIDNRYEIIDKLGSGGMAVVYKGKDRLLSRTVTIKVLREQYTSDADIVRRFQKEAQAVAKLSHPNIVSIYDVGQENGLYYLVMEYIKGQTLKEIIQTKGRLTSEEAVDYAIQICDALQHAHESNVIHRDIKPQNILVTERGQAKVTDFGIAQAVSSATLTYSGNSIIGTVQYISPEQARGEIATVHTDIYSAGIVLYEMVTGVLPFQGDTAIGIAIKHIQAEYPRASTVIPDLPANVETIIAKAMAKDPKERFSDAREMRDHLELAGKGRLGFAREGERVSETRTKGGKRRIRPVAWLLLAFLIMLIPLISYFGFQKYLAVQEIVVPEVASLPLSQAEAILLDAGLQWERDRSVHDTELPKDHIISQKPHPGEKIKRTRPVLLTISLGPELGKVPDVIGFSEREGKVEIANAGFELAAEMDKKHSSEIGEGLILNQDPAPNQEMPLGSTVHLTLSLGPQPRYISMPNLLGKSLQEATTVLSEHLLELGDVDNEVSYDYFSGQVVKQDVLPGDQILQKSTINLALSIGPGPTPKIATVQVRTQDDGNQHRIRILIIDQKGEHEEYNALHEGNDFISVDVPYFGKGKAQVYEDDQLIHETTLP